MRVVAIALRWVVFLMFRYQSCKGREALMSVTQFTTVGHIAILDMDVNTDICSIIMRTRICSARKVLRWEFTGLTNKISYVLSYTLEDGFFCWMLLKG